MKPGLFIADVQAEAGDNTNYTPIHGSFEYAVEHANEMFDEGNDDDGVVYIYELVLVGKVKAGKPVVERV